ncbi:hypothetical protein SAMN05444320_101851 [Streptoalloteichus hindustanus]|uniref:Uncharacterized protein n=1 Tax=Streptoalloteichus hindustanus TaxID=2017 RepID=A0A1M4VQ16_STRHI|nr:hypothetical protein SAMN05444320_101851 [Streptoalloteichus hindustanus]
MRGSSFVVGLVGVLLVGVVGGEAARTSQLRAEASRQVRALLPAASVSPVTVRGFPLLLTALDGVVTQADTSVTTSDGRPGHLVLSEFDVSSGHARSALLVIRLAPMGSDLREPRTDAGQAHDTVEHGGRRWRLVTSVDGNVVRVGPEDPDSGLATVVAVVPPSFRGATPQILRATERETSVELRADELGGR